MAQIILDSNNNLIQGDFDNATLNNRTKLQTTTTNATTNVYVVPNGSSTSAGVSVANNSSLTNASKIVMATNGTTDTQIISGVNGSGSYLPLSFYTNNALTAQMDTSGRILSPLQPRFFAYRDAGDVTVNGTTIVYNVAVTNIGSCYNTSTGIFTAPVNGWYLFSATQISSNTANTESTIYLNNSTFIANFRGASSGAGTSAGASTSLIYYLSANDNIRIKLSGAVSTYSSAGGLAYTYFTGGLLG
jgi:hypothetical protein